MHKITIQYKNVSINQSFISSIITMTLIKEFFLMMKIKVLLQYFESLRDVVSEVCGSRRILTTAFMIACLQVNRVIHVSV